MATIRHHFRATEEGTFHKRLTALTRMLGVAAAMVVLVVGAVPQAQASPSAAYIGDGYPNNPHGVWCVQHLINDVYEDIYPRMRPIPEDGLWGPNTKWGVKWFQDQVYLYPDGIVGRATGQKILEEGDSYYGGHNYCYSYVPNE
ncbi:peptidoglycan-binding domain-containing protein [Streptomyces sp. NPDC001833]|uniref:peptidoglycan-binding domain-containing protein n=1 Tax=Streptomyces sp. NPDC001833 TaxID=3154658 RepID=UPI00333099AE